MSSFTSVAVAFLGAFLTKFANMAWDDLWDKLYKLIAEAEKLYYQDGGAKRKDWVIDQTIKWMEEFMKPNVVQRWILRSGLDIVVDVLVKALNDSIGHDWVEKAKEMEHQLSQMLPIIE